MTDRISELDGRLGLRMRDITLLEKATNTDGIGCGNEGFNEGECCNCALAEVGDAALELILAETLCAEGKKGRRITDVRKSTGRRMMLRRIAVSEGICSVEDEENRFIEAIVGAKMMDSGYFECRDWVDSWLKPRMESLMGKGLGECPAKDERRRCSNRADDLRWI